MKLSQQQKGISRTFGDLVFTLQRKTCSDSMVYLSSCSELQRPPFDKIFPYMKVSSLPAERSEALLIRAFNLLQDQDEHAKIDQKMLRCQGRSWKWAWCAWSWCRQGFRIKGAWSSTILWSTPYAHCQREDVHLPQIRISHPSKCLTIQHSKVLPSRSNHQVGD